MGVEVNGLDEMFEELDDLEDDYGDEGEDWQVGRDASITKYAQ